MRICKIPAREDSDQILNQINVNNKQLSTILKILVPLDYPYEDSPNNSKINCTVVEKPFYDPKKKIAST